MLQMIFVRLEVVRYQEMKYKRVKVKLSVSPRALYYVTMSQRYF